MRSLTNKERVVIGKVVNKFKYYGGRREGLGDFSVSEVLDLIKYCKRLLLKPKKKMVNFGLYDSELIKNKILNEGEQPGTLLETNNENGLDAFAKHYGNKYFNITALRFEFPSEILNKMPTNKMPTKKISITELEEEECTVEYNPICYYKERVDLYSGEVGHNLEFRLIIENNIR